MAPDSLPRDSAHHLAGEKKIVIRGRVGNDGVNGRNNSSDSGSSSGEQWKQ